jgi:uncharacterized protein
MATRRKIQCPQCGAATEYAPGNPFRPFCSERCKLIDMGAWASGHYRIPSAEPGDEEDGTGQEPHAAG